MTPKEKAIDIAQKYLLINKSVSKHWKQCALTAVDEIHLLLQRSSSKDDPYANLQSLEYWQEVKDEIEKI
jgi:hypothetical protein